MRLRRLLDKLLGSATMVALLAGIGDAKPGATWRDGAAEAARSIRKTPLDIQPNAVHTRPLSRLGTARLRRLGRAIGVDGRVGDGTAAHMATRLVHEAATTLKGDALAKALDDISTTGRVKAPRRNVRRLAGDGERALAAMERSLAASTTADDQQRDFEAYEAAHAVGAQLAPLGVAKLAAIARAAGLAEHINDTQRPEYIATDLVVAAQQQLEVDALRASLREVGRTGRVTTTSRRADLAAAAAALAPLDHFEPADRDHDVANEVLARLGSTALRQLARRSGLGGRVATNRNAGVAAFHLLTEASSPARFARLKAAVDAMARGQRLPGMKADLAAADRALAAMPLPYDPANPATHAALDAIAALGTAAMTDVALELGIAQYVVLDDRPDAVARSLIEVANQRGVIDQLRTSFARVD